MTSLSNHKRYHEFSLSSCFDPFLKDETSTLNIILFMDDRKLRNHAVKHLTNPGEFEAVWGKMVPLSNQAISENIEFAKSIGCLYFSLGAQSPPCNACRLFDRCTDIMRDVDDAYLKCAEQVIEQCCRIPRFAYFIAGTSDQSFVFALPDRPIVMKASQLDKKIFNLMTLYNRPDIAFTEFRENEIRKISYQAERNNISWCTEETWGMEIHSKETISPKKAKKGKKKLKPYKKNCKQNWKEYLDEWNDW
jgi:hypothetical protein